MIDQIATLALQKCVRCKQEQPLTEFYVMKKRWLWKMCKTCHRKENNERYRRNFNHISKRTKQYSTIHQELQRQQRKRGAEKLRLDIFSYYSKPTVQCACCNESEIDFLTLDHINNNGAEERRKVGAKLYRWLRTNQYPPGYQILCFNCNCARYFRGNGICPHKKIETIKKK